MVLSYVHGISDKPLIGVTVSGLFDHIAAEHGDNEALVVTHQQIRWTYRELKEKVDRLAAGLVAIGLNAGERVGIWAPNCAEWVVTQFATAKAGLILVNINPAYRLGELEYALNKVGCRALILAPEFKSSDYHGMMRDLAPEIVTATPGELKSASLPDLRYLITLSEQETPGFLNYRDISAGADADAEQKLTAINAGLQFDDPINIQFTSGTTGLPKAATLTHHNIVNNAYFTGERMQFGSADKLCIPLPSAGYEPGAALQAIEGEQCTAVHGVPTMFIAELDLPHFEQFDLDSLRTGIIAGAPCPIELMKRLIAEMHLDEITIAYGMTETGPVSFQTSAADTVERKVSTVGTVLPHTEIKIIDEDEQKTAETIDTAHWLHSGDIAVLDDEGYCQIVGRLKDMLIRGGENIFPREIEEYLFQHPKIEAAEVIGVPDEKYGEEVCAWIKLHEGETATEEDIREFCRERIAHFKIPRYILFVDEFPMTITGKVQKYKMREQMISKLGLE